MCCDTYKPATSGGPYVCYSADVNRVFSKIGANFLHFVFIQNLDLSAKRIPRDMLQRFVMLLYI